MGSPSGISTRSSAEDRISFWGVIGLVLIALAVLVLSTLLALRGVPVPSSWETMAGAAVGSLGTLIVTKAGSRDGGPGRFDSAMEEEVERLIRRAMNPQATPQAAPQPTGAFTAATGPTILAGQAAPVEGGLYQGE